MTTSRQHVLSDLKVLDFTRALAGPTCTRMMAELGATVIKVESAPAGDTTRQISHIRNPRSLHYGQQNLGKKSLCVDLRDPRGMALVSALIPQVDVVVENFKPGTLAALGLGEDDIAALASAQVVQSGEF